MANIRVKSGTRAQLNAAAAANQLAAKEPYLISDEGRFAVGTGTGAYTAFQKQGEAVVAAETHAATSKAAPVDADELPLADSAASFGIKKLTFANLKATLFAYFQGLFREKLTAARTYYVRTDGSDSNDGLSNTSGGAFLTSQKAVDVASALDNGGFNITIQLADGTYTSGITLKSFVGSGAIVINGNASTPSNVLISVASGHVVQASAVVGAYELRNFRLTSAASGNLINAVTAPTYVRVRGLVFGSAGGGSVYAHVSAQGGAVVDFSATNYAVNGGAGYHLYTAIGGRIECNVLTCTISGTPAFSGSFAYASMGGVTRVVSVSFSGSATGKRYEATGNGIVQTLASTTALPGNATGTTTPGGLYLGSEALAIGYGAGYGGSVTQATSKTTAVTLNKPCGVITTNNAALASNGIATFTLNNSLIGANDTVILSFANNYGGSYLLRASCGAGLAYLTIHNIYSTSLSDALPINFAVIAGSAS